MDDDNKQGFVYSQRSLATSRLIDELKKGKPEDIITDDELAEIAGGPAAPGGPHYAHLMSAIRYCRDREGVYWERVRGAGLLKCRTHPERVDAAEARVKTSHRAARRAMLIGRTVDVSDLGVEDAKRHTATMAVAALQAKAGERRVRAAIMAGQPERDAMKQLAERVVASREKEG